MVFMHHLCSYMKCLLKPTHKTMFTYTYTWLCCHISMLVLSLMHMHFMFYASIHMHTWFSYGIRFTNDTYTHLHTSWVLQTYMLLTLKVCKQVTLSKLTLIQVVYKHVTWVTQTKVSLGYLKHKNKVLTNKSTFPNSKIWDLMRFTRSTSLESHVVFQRSCQNT